MQIQVGTKIVTCGPWVWALGKAPPFDTLVLIRGIEGQVVTAFNNCYPPLTCMTQVDEDKPFEEQYSDVQFTVSHWAEISE